MESGKSPTDAEIYINQWHNKPYYIGGYVSEIAQRAAEMVSLSWKEQLERDAFSIAFPNDTLEPDDSVTVEMSYFTGGRVDDTYDDYTLPPNYFITVVWKAQREKVSQFNPANKRGWETETTSRTYEGPDAVVFWHQLMELGSGGSSD